MRKVSSQVQADLSHIKEVLLESEEWEGDLLVCLSGGVILGFLIVVVAFLWLHEVRGTASTSVSRLLRDIGTASASSLTASPSSVTELVRLLSVRRVARARLHLLIT